MAELIPLEYRLQVVKHRLIRRWVFIGSLAAVVAAGSLVFAYSWKQQRAADYAKVDSEYRGKSVLIKQAKDLQAKRLDLAARMQKMQELRDDRALLSLLKSVSSGFSDNDCLEFIKIDAHGTEMNTGSKSDLPKYYVRVQGITSNDTTHSKLLERLTEVGKQAEPPINVPLGEKRLKKMLDGEVTVFDITCEPLLSKGG